METTEINPLDSSAEDFESIWPDGYAELFGGNQSTEYQVVRLGLLPFYDPKSLVLEIGCGRGLWTLKYLCPHFRHVIALDVIPKPESLTACNLDYIKVPSRNFNCFSIEDNSIDLVWSYGCFCHLSGNAQQQYFKAIHRVLRPGGKAIVMTGKWQEREDRSGANIREHGPGVIWFYNDESLSKQYIAMAGLVNYRDLMPNDHDILTYSEKPYGS